MAFNKSQSAQPGEDETKKPNQKKQMLILLLIIALFGYLYFFTGLLRPSEEVPPAEPAKKEMSAMVKQPIPKREGADTAAADKKEPVVKPAPAVPEATKTPSPTPKPAVATPVPAPVAAKPAQAPPPAPKVAPKAAATPVKTAIPTKGAAPAAKPASTKPVVAAEKTAVTTAKFTLLVGEFPEGKLLNEIKATIRKAGISKLHIKSGNTSKQMHRLVVGEYSEHDQALTEVQKLRKKGVDAFLGESGEKFIVYAGSYLYADRAEVERDRLAKLGMTPTIAKSEISIRLAKVTAGTFETAEKAQAAAEKLKVKGLTVDVVELGK